MHKGPPGTWEILPSPGKYEPVKGAGGESQLAQASDSPAELSRERINQRYPVTASEGNEAKRDGRQGVLVPS